MTDVQSQKRAVASAVGTPRILPPYFEELKAAVECRCHCALLGPRGTGKTTAVKTIAAQAGRPLRVVQAHADLTTEELRGTPGLRDGNSTFIRGAVVDAAEKGEWLLVDEANLARPGVTAWLNNVLDEAGTVSIPDTGEAVAVHPGFRAFFCFNAGYQGTRQLNEALLDRCRVVYCPYWPAPQELAVLRDRLPRMTSPDLERMVRVANGIREARRKGAVEFDFSLRTLIQWGADADHRSQDLMDSFQSVVLPKVGDPLEFGPQHQALLEIARLVLAKK